MVELQSELVGEQSADVGEHTEDTDATGEGSGFGIDIVGGTTDVISTRSSVCTHRYHHRLLGLESGDGTPYLLRGIGTTAGRVDTQHDSLDIVVVHQSLKVGHYITRTNG